MSQSGKCERAIAPTFTVSRDAGSLGSTYDASGCGRGAICMAGKSNEPTAWGVGELELGFTGGAAVRRLSLDSA